MDFEHRFWLGITAEADEKLTVGRDPDRFTLEIDSRFRIGFADGHAALDEFAFQCQCQRMYRQAQDGDKCTESQLFHMQCLIPKLSYWLLAISIIIPMSC